MKTFTQFRACYRVMAVFLVILAPGIAFAADFEQQLGEMGMTFTMPEGHTAIMPQENDAMNYDYAIKHAAKHYEIRYALRPLSQEMLAAYTAWAQQTEKDANTILTDPNALFEPAFQAILLNLAESGTAKQPQHFEPDAVQAEFGADAGLLTTLKLKPSAFAGDYTQCALVGIHKQDVGPAYIVHLFNDYNEVKELMNGTFYMLRFTVEQQK